MTEQTQSIDSYDALALSIERVLRTDIEPPWSAAHLVGSIDQIMLAEARAGELRLGLLRLVVVAPLLAVGFAALFRVDSQAAMPAALAVAVLGAAWLVVSAVVVLALRRGWYRRWIARVMPLVDAGMMLALVLAAWRTGALREEPRAEMLAYVTALCAFLSVSGSLRLSRSDARMGTALAVAVCVIAGAFAGIALVPLAAIALTILAVGLLSASVTSLLRRMVTDEVARATLSTMYKEAEQTIEARQQVLRIVSHDLRNPLGTISMAASLMLDVPMSHEAASEHLHRIKRAGERMNRLIQDLLDVARFEAGHVKIDVRSVELAPIVREAQEMLAPLAAEKGIRLDVRLDETLSSIQADGGRLLQVLSNLVGNAIKVTPREGRIIVGVERVAGMIRFSVSDTGQGMTPEQLDKIFGQFWQANPADRRGIGLGLSIAKGIVEAHGGRIWVESRVGEGSTFFFTLEAMPES
jgi:signal transduction histidine kinase